jgi:tRNA A-37 threonylcarbamoyl transferase component Bud32
MDSHRRILTYQLREELGHDQLGRVFRAWDLRTQKPVILRLLRAASVISGDREESARVELRRRIRAAAHVAHPNLASVLDITPYSDLEVVAYEDFGGVPIVEHLGRGVPAVEALRYAIETTAAISRAHARGVHHGRISLTNIMIARDDSVRVLDLGLPRPKEITFLIEDVPEANGVYKAVQRDARKAQRRDLNALAEVVQSIVSTGPEDAPDGALRESISRAVGEAIQPVLKSRPGAIIGLHAALVDVARRTPADARHGTVVLARTPPNPAAPPAAEPSGSTAGVPSAATVSGKQTEPAQDRVPFSLGRYGEAAAQDARRPRDSAASLPSLRAWGAAAFDVGETAGGEEEVFEEEVEEDPLEPPVMTGLFLPPTIPGEKNSVDWDNETEGGIRFWPHVAGALAVGILLAIGLFSLEVALRPPLPANAASDRVRRAIAARDASEIVQVSPPPGAENAALVAAPRPVARTGQPAGILVISVTQDSVSVSIDGSRSEPAPVTWDDVPAGQFVLRVERPGYRTRVDTVTVRAGLTTTRYYVLIPER